MHLFRKSLVLIPVIIAYLICNKTWADFIAMLFGGVIIWVPYWLAWWLSDGFGIFNAPCNYEYKYGKHGAGYYSGDRFIHH